MDRTTTGAAAGLIAWEGAFRRGAAAAGSPLAGAADDPGAAPRIAGFAPGFPPRLLVVVGDQPGPPRRGAALWAADLDGGRPIRLAVEPQGAIGAVEPAPSGHRVAYEVDAGARGSRVGVASVRGGGAIVAVEARAPGWTPDGRTLLLLRREAGGWRPSRAHLLGGIAPAAAGRLDAPAAAAGPSARFSPDGRRVAGTRAGRVVTLDLDAPAGPPGPPGPAGGAIVPAVAAAAAVAHPAAATHLDAIAWSPDGGWLYLRRLLPDGVACPIPHLALRVADGRKLDLDRLVRAAAGAGPAGGAPIRAAAWLPGAGPRLLALGGDGRGWAIDLDRQDVAAVAVPPDLAPGLGRHLHASPSSPHAALGPALFALAAPPARPRAGGA